MLLYLCNLSLNMPELFDLHIPNKEGRKALFRLELLIRGIGPSQISIYHRRVEKDKSQKDKFMVKTYAFCFAYGSGKLTYASSHKGDFTKPNFRWSDSRDKEFEGDDIPGDSYLQALGYVRKICGYLREEKEKVSTYKERDKCERFLSPLERMLDQSK